MVRELEIKMIKAVSNIVLLSVLVSCGAADNGDSRQGDPNAKPTDRTTQAADSVKLRSQLRSQMFRFKGKEIYTYTGEQSKIQKNELPATHRTIPNTTEDIPTSVDLPKALANPNTSCGNTKEGSMTARHNACLVANGNVDLMVFWNGKNQGIQGEGGWQLISNSKPTTGANKVVWQDLTTGYLWSDVHVGYTWEEAAGIGETNLTNRPCQAKADAPKDELGRIGPDVVSWRLPNRNEFLQADLNGSKYILPNKDEFVWTASYAGSNTAWAIKVATGELVLRSIDDSLGVRCIGVVLK